MLPPCRISRDDLLRSLHQAGLRVSTVQLRGWRDAGLLGKGVRTSLGRPRGMVSHYPWWAVLQAAALATLLKQRRNLDEAGWATWVFGFPVTPFARQLLLTDLRRQQHLYRRLLKPGAAERAAPAFARDHRAGGALLHQAARSHLPQTLRFMADLHLGRVLTHLPGGEALEDVQLDLARWHELITGAEAGTLTSSDLLDDAGIRTAVAHFTRTGSIPALRRALSRLPAAWLCLARDEAQTLSDRLATAVGWEDAPIITRPTYMQYLCQRFLDPAAAKDTVAALRALGWTRPPASPLAKLILRLRKATHPGDSI